MSDTITLGTLEIHSERAVASIEALHRELEALEHIGGEVGHAFGGLTHAAESFGQILSGHVISGVAGATSSLHEFASAMATMASEAEAQERALVALGHDYELISEATRDTMDETDALRLRNRLLEEGIHATGEELAAVAGAARNYAQRAGEDATTATERLTRALLTNSDNGLARFGVRASEATDHARQFHDAASQLRTILDRTGPAAETSAEAMHTFDREVGDSVNVLMRSYAEAIHLRDALHWLTEALSTSATINTTNAESRERANAAMTAGIANVQRLGLATTALRINQAELTDQERESYGLAISRSGLTQEQYNRHIETINRMVETRHHAAEQREQQSRAEHAAAEQAERDRQIELDQQHALDAAYEQSNRDAANRHGGGGGSGRASATVIAAMREEMAEAIQIHAVIEGLVRRRGETEEQYYRRFTQHLHEAVQARREQVSADEQLEDELEQARQATNAAEITRYHEEQARLRAKTATLAEETRHEENQLHALADTYTQVSLAARAAFQLQTTSAQQWASLTRTAIDTATSAFKAHYKALITGKEDAATALKGYLEDVLAEISAEAAVKSLMSFAEAIAAAAGDRYDAAAKFAAAGVEFAAVAAATGGAAYGISRIGAGGQQSVPASNNGAGGRAGPAPNAGSSLGGGGNMTVVYNFNGAVLSPRSAEARQFVSDTMVDLHYRQQMPFFQR